MKKLLFLLLLLGYLFCDQTLHAETTFEIGDGTIATNLPFCCDQKYSTTQMLFTSEEIGRSYIIKSISFYCKDEAEEEFYDDEHDLVTGYPAKINIYMAHTTKTSFSRTSDAISYSTMTKVYSKNYYELAYNDQCWESFTLSTPFEYDGEHNLAIIVEREYCVNSYNTTIKVDSSIKYNSTLTSNNMCLWRGGNSSDYSNCSSSTAYSTLSKNRPNVKMKVELPSIPEETEETIEISGAKWTNQTPINTYENYSISQSIYTPTEIGRSGWIREIDFKAYNTFSISPITSQKGQVLIYMGHKSTATFSSASDNVKLEDLTLVYTGSPSFSAKTWCGMRLDSPFKYDGYRNLVVVVCASSSNLDNTISFESQQIANKCLVRSIALPTSGYNYSESTGCFYPMYAAVSAEYGYTVCDYRPAIQLKMSDNVYEQPTSFYVHVGMMSGLPSSHTHASEYWSSEAPLGQIGRNVTQTLYYPSDFGNRGGVIKRLEYEVATYAGNPYNIRVYMGTQSNFASSSSGLTKVFEGKYQYDATNNRIVIPLTSPYLYDGTSNLLVYFENDYVTNQMTIYRHYYNGNTYTKVDSNSYKYRVNTIFELVAPCATHSYQNSVKWTWADDLSSAKASKSCSQCGNTLWANATITTTTVTNATCTSDGQLKHVATATLTNQSYTDTKYVSISKLGHNFTYTNNLNGTHKCVCSRGDYNSTQSHSNTSDCVLCGNRPVTSISLTSAVDTMAIGQSKLLTATVLPSDATISTLTWTSSNSSVVSIGGGGIVNAIASGTATITASATDQSGKSVSCDYTIYVLGDANGNNKVNIADVSTIACYMNYCKKAISTPPTTFVFAAANANHSNSAIDVADITSTVDIAWNGIASAAHARQGADRGESATTLYALPLSMQRGDKATLSVVVDNPSQTFSAFEFSICLPEGFRVEQHSDGTWAANLSTERTTTDKTDCFTANVCEDGSIYILCYSTQLEQFEGTEGTIATLSIETDHTILPGSYELKISDILLSGFGEMIPCDDQIASITVLSTDGIEEISDSSNCHGYIFDVNGRIIKVTDQTVQSLQNLPSGIYVINGKKVLK